MPKTRALHRKIDEEEDEFNHVCFDSMKQQLESMRKELDSMRNSLQVKEIKLNQREEKLNEREVLLNSSKSRANGSTSCFVKPIPFDGKTSTADFLERQESHLNQLQSDEERITLVSQLLGSAWPNFRAWQRQATEYSYNSLR